MADKLMRTMVVMTFFLILALFSGCGTNGISLTEADNGRQFTLQTGDTLTVSLASNPTTGYGWQVLEIQDAILIQKGEPEFKQATNSEGLVGAGGIETLRFEAVGSGKTSLKLGYMRPWESVPPTETFEITIDVKG